MENDSSIPSDNDNIVPPDNWPLISPEISPVENSPDIPDNSLVGYWSFDEGQGGTVHDNSGQNNHGIIHGNPQFVDERFGKALEFNGEENVAVPPDASLSPALITVSAWIYPTQFPAAGEPNDHFIGKWESGGYQYVAYLSAGGCGQVRLQVMNAHGNFNESRSNASVPLNAWSHFAATWDGSDIRIYINGSEGTTAIHKQFTGDIRSGDSPLRIGLGDSSGFHGRIDEVMIYDWALGPDNVAIYAVIDATPARRVMEALNIDLENVEITTIVNIVHYDENGVRQESSPLTLDVSLTEPTLLALPAVVDIDPDTLNLKSNGEWITAYIELPENYGAEHVRGEPYELEVETDGELMAHQQELVDNLIQEIDASLAAVNLELEAEGGVVDVELEGYLSEQGQALLDELTQELEREGNEVEFSIEKEIDWGNYRTTIDISSVRLENVPAVSDLRYGFVREPELEDRDGNGLPELMVKFDRSAVQALLQPGEVRLTISGRLVDWLPFEGSGTIRAR